MPAWFSRRLRPGVLIAACALALVAVSISRHAQADEPSYFAIRNARIVPVSSPPMDGGTVVIAHGLIAAVGKDVAIPPEAWVIDGTGLTVYPGLIDALSEVGMPVAQPAPQGGGRGGQQNVAALVAAGQNARPSRGPQDRPATTPWVVASDELQVSDRRIETWRNAGFTTTLSAPSNGIFPGQGAILDLAGEEPGQMVLKAPASLQINTARAGGFGGGFPSALMGVLAYVKQVFIDTAWYAQSQPIYDAHPRGSERPEYDRTERVVLEALRSGEPVLVPANTELQIRRMIEMAPEWSTHIVIYGVQEGYKVPNEIAASKIPVLVSLRWPEPSRDADPEAQDSLRVLRFRDKAPSTPGLLSKAGVKFAFYSDGITNPKDILRNAKKSIDAGLSADIALRAFTLDASQILGVADRIGSIESGKIANLVVTTGDIFGDRTQVKHVFVDGQHFNVREPELPPPGGRGQGTAANLTGHWIITYDAGQGQDQASLDLMQRADGTLSGSINSHLGAAQISSGSLNGAQFNFSFSMDIQGQSTRISCSGSIEGNAIRGSFDVGGQAVPFTGTRSGGPPGSMSDHEGAQR